MKILKTASYKKAFDMDRYESEGMIGEDVGGYTSDEDIASEFSGMKINNIEVKPSGSSGWIDASFPEGGEHVGGGANEVTDHWIKYDDGRIAFDNWYPSEISMQLTNAINSKLEETAGGLEETKPAKMPKNNRTKWDAEGDFTSRLNDEFSGYNKEKQDQQHSDKWNQLFNKDKKRQPAFASKNNKMKIFKTANCEKLEKLAGNSNLGGYAIKLRDAAADLLANIYNEASPKSATAYQIAQFVQDAKALHNNYIKQLSAYGEEEKRRGLEHQQKQQAKIGPQQPDAPQQTDTPTI